MPHDIPLTNMKRTGGEGDTLASPSAQSDQPAYPFGLSIHLDEESMRKLAMNELPKVGDTMLVYARVKVESTSENETQEGADRHAGLQITEMALLDDGGEQRQTHEVLYGERG